MKKIIILSVFTLFSSLLSAQNPYKNMWQKVMEFEQKGLPKSALKEVEKIYQLAKKENNTGQLIKSILFKSKYALTLKENAQLQVINDIKTEIASAKTPEKNILESILANLYWQYFNRNRWRFYDRTHTTTKIDSTDFRTWDLQTIFKEIDKHHKKALENSLEIQQIPIKTLDVILVKQENSEKHRPTVYDFIAHNALEFYKTGESNLPQPANKFEIKDPKFLGDVATFLSTDFEAPDLKSQKLQALKLYKNLTLFHKNDTDKTALVALTLDRLDFVKNNARFDNVNNVYLKTLQKLQKTYRKLPISTEIDYRIAKFYSDLAQQYTPEKPKNQFKFRDALEVCEIAKINFPNSRGAKKCENLKQQILSKSYNILSEIFVLENKKSFAKIEYRNVPELFFRIYKVSENQEKQLPKLYKREELLNKIKTFELVTTFNQKLKTVSDFQSHSTEVVLPKLTDGRFLILASNDSNFSDFNSFSYNFIQVTDIAYVQTTINGKYQFQFVHRNSGKPLEGLQVHIKNTETNRYNKKINLDEVTDKNGFITITPSDYHERVKITVTKNGKKTVFKYFNFGRNYRNNHLNLKNKRIFLFTDRSIYRPSQTVYFKGIAIIQKENKSEILAQERLKVRLRDVNNQIVKELEFVTNEFGSFSGKFTLPESGLTGNYSIEVRGKNHLSGYSNFSVEEYKRPKFYAKLLPVKENFKLNDSVTVKGEAMAYAGSTVTDAKVTYRVTRMVQYPKWFYWFRPSFSSEAQEITNGTTTTDENGNFNISFVAKPDLSVKKEDNPIFSYEVSADITDINGETRSTKTIVKIGYHSLVVALEFPEKLDKEAKNQKITIATKNLNGEFYPTKGKLKIYKVKAPKNVKRKRPWKAPDFPILSKEEWENTFPHDFYKKPNPFKELGKLVYQTNFDTNKSKEINLPKFKKWLSGKYIAIAEVQDSNGETIQDKQLFALYSKKDKKVADKQLLVIQTNKDSYKPNENICLRVGSASKKAHVVLQVERDKRIVQTKIIALSDAVKSTEIPVNQKDLGGFAIHYHLVNFNALEKGTLQISVPYPKTNLEIETVTFRDKLQPNQEETWSFKIKGTQKDKVLAEVLASMYDANLDQFKPHKWEFNPIYRSFYYPQMRTMANDFGQSAFRTHLQPYQYISVSEQQYDRLNWFGFYFGNNYYGGGIVPMMAVESDALEEVVITKASPRQIKKMRKAEAKSSRLKGKVSGVQTEANNSIIIDADSIDQDKINTQESSSTETDFSNVKIRTNFNETAFFFPHLRTDKNGNVSFTFTTPESLTKWKLQLLAHDKNLHSALKTLEAVTQKDLMVLPNAPRFLRQADTLVFQTKIANISDKNLNGTAKLQLFDAVSDEEITATLLQNANPEINFSVKPKENTVVSYKIVIPLDVQAVRYKIMAKAGDFSDGEQQILPVLTNRMLVTETLPMWIRSNQTKTFVLKKLQNTTSKSLQNHRLTLEITLNPAWYAVQTLPYLMEYPYECAEQTFSRFYANSLASHIANSNPKIQQVFYQWKNTDALLSNLEKNQELKSLIIQETPWLRDAESETEQKKRIALLFDLHKMSREQNKALRKLKQMQMPSGGFPWFKGSRYENRFITQHIVAGFGHLIKLNVIPTERGTSKEESQMLPRAISYLDNQILKDYTKLQERAKRMFANAKNPQAEIEAYLQKNHTSHFQIHYLYTRSFFTQNPISDKVKKAVDYYTNQSYKYWLGYNLYTKGLIALVAKRNENNAVAEGILRSLKETAINNEELGMYWKENTASYFWYQAPIETQALLIETFTELNASVTDIDNLKIWLLKNKQTNRWKTTKATSEAVYALLLQGTDWLETTDFVKVKIGDQVIDPLKLPETKVEAETGYFKKSWKADEIEPKIAEVTLTKKGKGIAWGAMYWQYFEDLDKITFAKTPLQLTKKLFIKTNGKRGKELTEITDNTKVQVGDLVTVRIELKVDRPMEFIHLKDMRASGFEPVNILSRYKWQDGLGYYESTKDAATNFFISYLPKGVYVFEYDLRANNAGDFSNGITTIQSMYAPEFTSHSKGIRLRISK